MRPQHAAHLAVAASEAEMIFLGTGAKQPSRYRNVSSILLLVKQPPAAEEAPHAAAPAPSPPPQPQLPEAAAAVAAAVAA